MGIPALFPVPLCQGQKGKEGLKIAAVSEQSCGITYHFKMSTQMLLTSH